MSVSSRSSTSSPATVVKKSTNNGGIHSNIPDLDDMPPLERSTPDSNITDETFEEDEDDSELRVKATISKVVKGVKVVEAVTKKHGVYKLSISDILGANNYKPHDLTGAEIVIVLGPKRPKRKREFLWATLADDWPGPDDEEAEMDIPIKEEALENALINLQRFYKFTLKNSGEANRQIANLKDEVANAPNMQSRVAIISHHLTLASQSFMGIDVHDDESVEDLITSTRCSSVAKGKEFLVFFLLPMKMLSFCVVSFQQYRMSSTSGAR